MEIRGTGRLINEQLANFQIRRVNVTIPFLVLLYGGPADHLITAQSVRHVVNSEIEPDERASIIGDLAGIKNMDRAPRLSQREKEILQYYGRGYTFKAIGYELGISPKSA